MPAAPQKDSERLDVAGDGCITKESWASCGNCLARKLKHHGITVLQSIAHVRQGTSRFPTAAVTQEVIGSRGS